MRRLAEVGAVIALCLAVCGGMSRAGETETQQELARLRQQLDAQQKRIDALEGLLRGTIAKDVSALRREVDAVSQRADAAPFASWAEKVKFKGDIRYRHEFIDDQNKYDGRERQRHRVRFRLSMEAHPTEDVAVYARFTSGGDEPTSTNQTLDGGFSSKGFMLDRAYIDWHPAALKGTQLLAGKMGVPFFKPNKTQLIWDGDLSVEGMAVKHAADATETTKLFAVCGGFWAEENAGSADIMLYGGQVGVTQQLGEDAKVTVGASGFHYTNIQGSPTLYSTTSSKGNSSTAVVTTSTIGTDAESRPVTTTSTSRIYNEDFTMSELFTQVDVKAGGLPIALFGDLVINHAADSDGNTGWLGGVQVGKAKKPGSWQFGYNYRVLEADSVIGAFNDSDFNGGGTGGEGHKLSSAYQINKAAQMALTYIQSNNHSDKGSEDSYRRLQLDFKVKF